ncbi:hypothetical protein [Roseateles sp. LYH14W]|uniref:Apea-like HEPN domain-containing protein n=1 Tax=Pelomonas parva TaxID=3299032 RepID=A0ABW7F0W4_9BURK
MKARLLPPSGDFTGNLLWSVAQLAGKEALLEASLASIRAVGYRASPYPEGDGVTFDKKPRTQTAEQILVDFQSAFPWLAISLGTTGSANAELAELESGVDAERTMPCTVIVPVEKLHFEESFVLGPFRFVCAIDFDPEPHERLGDWKGSYLEFDIDLPYVDLLRVNQRVSDNDVVILQCLSKAEQAMDVIRFDYSSFKRPEFTPNPAGQLESGMYSVEIIPLGQTHLKPVNLSGISRPMSSSNNWLGPQIEGGHFQGREYLEEVLHGRSDELAGAVKAALRFIRQAFYSLGGESKFLTLVFALDGLAHPDKSWAGMKHHAYIAALTSCGEIDAFKADLERYEELYTLVRNPLVHGGKDFYELPYDAMACCEDMLNYVGCVVELIGELDLSAAADLKAQAIHWLQSSAFASHIEAEVDRLNARDGKTRKNRPVPTW